MANKKRTNRILLILLAVVVILVVIGIIRGQRGPSGERVYVEEVKRRTIKETVSASGKIFPETEVKISSDVSGEVVALMVEEGDSVRTGDLLAQIDPETYVSAVERGSASVSNAEAQLANARAGIESSRAQVQQIKAQLENARAVHQRNTQLYNEGVVSEQEFEASLSNLRSLEANLESAQANLRSSQEMARAAAFSVKSAEASLKELKTSLKRTELYAPTTGIISRLNVEEGERVVGTIQMTGTELMRIADMRSMEVQVDVSENDVLRVSVGDSVDIEVDAYLDRIFKGTVTEIANSATNVSTATLTSDQVTNFVVKIRIVPESYEGLVRPENPYPFRPGMSASVEINTKTVRDVLSIPIQAVGTREKEDSDGSDEDDILEVIFVQKADTVGMVEVETGIQDDEYIEIKDGLSGDETVVIGPYSAVARKLEEGSPINVVDKEKIYGEAK